jgi:hypothetical protein
LLITANTINIAADLGGMAEAAALVTPIPAVVWAPVFTVSLIALLVWSSYRQIARVLKWFTLTLFAYIAAAFFSEADWRQILVATLVPRVEMSREFVSLLVRSSGPPFLRTCSSGKPRKKLRRNERWGAIRCVNAKALLPKNSAHAARTSRSACCSRTS